MAKRGMFEEFHSHGGDIECYLERLEQYFIATDIDGNEKRRAILLGSIGDDTYRTLKNLTYPKNPKDETYDKLNEILRKQYRPPRLVVAERFRFRGAKQEPGQSVNDFALNLKKLSSTCEFVGDQWEQNLRDQFICGLRSVTTQEKLLGPLAADYDFQQVVDTALAEEAALKDAKTFSGQGQASGSTCNRINQSMRRGQRGGRNKPRPSRMDHKTTNGNKKCDRCGLNNHSRDECKYKNYTCYKCQQVGHLKSECRSTKANNGNDYRRKRNGVHYNEYEDNDDQPDGDFADAICNTTLTEGKEMYDHGSDDTPGVTVGYSASSKPVFLPVEINGVKFSMELDTGAGPSMINIKDYNKYFSNVPLEPARKGSLHAYAGTPLEIAGEITVNVTYETQYAEALHLTVVNADKYAPPLLGREWLLGPGTLILDWHKLFPNYVGGQHSVTSSTIDELKHKYSDIFKKEIGTVQGMKAKLHMKDDAHLP